MLRASAPLRLLVAGMLLSLTAAACGDAPATPPAEALQVSPQNTSLLKGINRVSIALLDAHQTPVHVTDAQLQLADPSGNVVQTRPLQGIAAVYGGIPVYVTVLRFPDVGQYEYLVHATSAAGAAVSGHAYVTVQARGPEVAVGTHVPLVRQAILGDPGVTIGAIDSGVPPDAWHTATIAQGVLNHRAMVLYFGDPAYCPSKTCGPTREILQLLCKQFCGTLLFEHIETYYPAGPPANSKENPAFAAFGLQTDPWVYFVTASGVVSDRYEGPVTLDQLRQSAQGTLAGSVPAVAL